MGSWWTVQTESSWCIMGSWWLMLWTNRQCGCNICWRCHRIAIARIDDVQLYSEASGKSWRTIRTRLFHNSDHNTYVSCMSYITSPLHKITQGVIDILKYNVPLASLSNGAHPFGVSKIRCYRRIAIRWSPSSTNQGAHNHGIMEPQHDLPTISWHPKERAILMA